MMVILIVYPGRVACCHLASHSMSTGQRNRRTDGRQTVTLRSPLVAASVKWKMCDEKYKELNCVLTNLAYN